MLKHIIFKRLYETRRGFTGQGKPFINKVRVGMILARKINDGTVEFGYSSLHPDDKYNDKVAISLALTGTTPTPNLSEMPTRVRHEAKDFIKRAKNYFKDGIFHIAE